MPQCFIPPEDKFSKSINKNINNVPPLNEEKKLYIYYIYIYIYIYREPIEKLERAYISAMKRQLCIDA